MDGIIGYFPFVYALAAGVITMFSPCSAAMLPSYVALYLVDQDAEGISRLRRMLRAFYFSLAVTSGYMLLALILGTIVGLTGQLLFPLLPWLAVIIGMGLIGLGCWLLVGGHFTLGIFGQAAVKLHVADTGRFFSYLLFGVAYGLAALSCTLPVFLMVVVSAFVARGFVSGLIQFLAYCLGMTIVFLGIAIAVTFLREAVQHWLTRFVPLTGRISGGLLVLAGGYVIYYWLMTDGLLGLAVR